MILGLNRRDGTARISMTGGVPTTDPIEHAFHGILLVNYYVMSDIIPQLLLEKSNNEQPRRDSENSINSIKKRTLLYQFDTTGHCFT